MVWTSMLSRCQNLNHAQYPDYGGRGIKVCQRWKEYVNFLEDMNDPPSGLSLDRIDNDGDYEPGNCRWATRSIQQRNRRNSVQLTVAGKTLHLIEWSEKHGVEIATIRCRLKAGWSPENAVMIPSQRKKAGG